MEVPPGAHGYSSRLKRLLRDICSLQSARNIHNPLIFCIKILELSKTLFKDKFDFFIFFAAPEPFTGSYPQANIFSAAKPLQ